MRISDQRRRRWWSGPVLAVGGPAVTAEAPNQQVPCLAHVFQAQAVSAPQTVSDRILEIREPRSGSVGVR